MNTEKELKTCLLEFGTPAGLVIGSEGDTTFVGSSSAGLWGDVVSVGVAVVAVAVVVVVALATVELAAPAWDMVDNSSGHLTLEIEAWQIFSDPLPPESLFSEGRSDLKKTVEVLLHCFCLPLGGLP